MAVSKLNPSAGGIPYGNTAGRPTASLGKLYSNGEEKRLELYTNSGWQNIIAETPGVVSYTGSVLESNLTNTLVISGTNFTTGAIAYLIGNDGTEYGANTTTVNSIVQITAIFGALPANKEPYDIKVVNPSNLYGILPDAVSVNDTPSWTTAAGSLGTFNELSSVSVTVAATDEENNAITYSLASGSSLPSGITLNSSTGVISGTLPNISSDTTYTFTINASDGSNSTSRTFSITSLALVEAEVLVVAGGGGGGSQFNNNFEGGCGGGAGGLIETVKNFTRGSSYSITVGNGGAFSNVSSSINGSNGENSILDTLIAIGGGVGGGNNNSGSGAAGGSGGGSPNWGDQPGGAGLQPASASGGYGNPGGRHPVNIRVGAAAGGGGGGGGAGAAGSDVTSAFIGANGGIGKQSSITGAAVYYAGGGGGYGRDGSGAGGNGGGGAGGTTGTSGTPNTGGGGGGSQNGNSGAGGSGVVIIAYPNTFPALTIPGTLTYTSPTRAGYRVYRFTAGTGNITF